MQSIVQKTRNNAKEIKHSKENYKNHVVRKI